MLRKGVKLLIKKMVDYKKALVAILENTLENVNAGNTNITEEEASVIIDHLTMLNKGVATVSKAYACEHVLHITSNKFDYLVRIGYDPILSNPFPQMVDYSKEIDERVQYLQAMKERMSNTVQPANNPNNSLWSAIDSEIGSLNDEQRNILFSDAKYIQIDNQLKQLIQEALINSVKNVIEQSPNGKELLTQQLNYIKSSKNAIVAESNRKLELFEKFQIAAKANPNLTYKEFCESINK